MVPHKTDAEVSNLVEADPKGLIGAFISIAESKASREICTGQHRQILYIETVCKRNFQSTAHL